MSEPLSQKPENASQVIGRKTKKLRWGFSTGSAATAAALGAAVFLETGRPPDEVEILLPQDKKLIVKLAEAERLGGDGVKVTVVKDGGDDPDVTNGARISVLLKPAAEMGLTIVGDDGVGRVTKPGLVLPVGEWAVNPVPRAMLNQNLFPFLSGQGLEARISIRDGEKLALKTLNPRLGIVGGLSVLGTTGLVKPFSHQAYVATIDSALSVAKANGSVEVVLSTGGRSEGLARKMRPDLNESAFVQIADFFRVGLNLAVKHGFETIGLAEFFGKAVKQAANYPYTHAHHNDMDLGKLAGWLNGLNPEAHGQIAAAPTALAALEILKNHKSLDLIPIVAKKVLASARGHAGPGPKLWVTVFDFDGTILAQEFCRG
ncbi:MAG: cobalt-precorrin-5B (C(1))-methyltransferase CbiD [Deltaproteobacteria bacterium]|jgi:cobalt-precorrin-5B (C1)-methyltransferase|nr:cobalt-precorrin-5B (C(1))-methyltransferase CbiD [Deltaproteobacteria bacterium]